MKDKLQQNKFVVCLFMAVGHTVLSFNLLAAYQGECHNYTQPSTNFRHRRQPATGLYHVRYQKKLAKHAIRTHAPVSQL